VSERYREQLAEQRQRRNCHLFRLSRLSSHIPSSASAARNTKTEPSTAAASNQLPVCTGGAVNFDPLQVALSAGPIIHPGTVLPAARPSLLCR
jgi:hypothetical protein